MVLQVRAAVYTSPLSHSQTFLNKAECQFLKIKNFSFPAFSSVKSARPLTIPPFPLIYTAIHPMIENEEKIENTAIKKAILPTLLFWVITFAWVFVTDQVLYMFHDSISRSLYQFLSTTKGIVFIIGLGIFFFYLYYNNAYAQYKAGDEIRKFFKRSPYKVMIFNSENLKIATASITILQKLGYNESDMIGLSLSDLVDRKTDLLILEELDKKMHINKDVGSILIRAKNEQMVEFYCKIMEIDLVYGRFLVLRLLSKERGFVAESDDLY